MTQAYPTLFSPFRLGAVELRNRVVSPPMYQVRPVLSPEGLAWHRRLAAGGAGLVIVEGTSVKRLATKTSADDLRPLVEAIHDEGAAAAIQLFPVIADDVTGPDDPTTGQLDTLVEHFGRAAAVCAEAGFDGVEPHGAHGFLLNQFLMPDRNGRTDKYGGSPEGRGRLAVSIVEQVRRVAGDGLAILFRHTPVGEGYGLDDSLAFVEKLLASGLDVLDVSPARADDVADLAAVFKARLACPVIAVGGMEDPDAAERALRLGRCDLVAVGRQLIADAQWPHKVRDGRLDEIVRCRKCDEACFGNLREGKPAACVQWPDDELAAYVR